MKKLVSVFLILSMLLTTFTTVSAGTIAEGSAYVPNPMDLELPVSVGAREHGLNNAYKNSVSIVVGNNEKKSIDYRAELDMAQIRDLFGEGFIQFVLATDAQAKAEFDAGIVSTTVNVLIEYPSSILKNGNINLASKNIGVLDAGSIFSEKARVENGNSLKITYVNKANLTVKELQANVNTYLKDITFTLDNTFAYSEAGNHIVKVTLSGETLLDFASKDQRVIYSGSASAVVNVAKDITVNNHELEVIPVSPASCFNSGKTEGIICRTHNSFDCGALGTKEQTVISALNHKSGDQSFKVHIDGESASCTQKGIKDHWTCSLCKSDFDTKESDVVKPHDNYVIPKSAHTVKILSAVEATCTTVGFKEGKSCSICDTILMAQEIIPAKGHDEKVLPAVNATCTEKGKTQGIECNRCHTVLTEPIDIPATGHKFGNWNIISEATETSTGFMERFCTNSGCTEKETQIIEKKPHSCVADNALAVVTLEPTCTKEGTKQNYCACGKPVGSPIAIPANGHKTEKVEGKAATCVVEGVTMHYTCVICDGIFRDKEATNPLKSVKIPVDKNNHGGAENFVTIKGIASTCIHQGFKDDGKKCKNCNIIVKPQSVLPLAPHKTEKINETPATCEGHGVKVHWHCEVCNKDFKDEEGNNECSSYELDIPALGHEYGPAEQTSDILVDNHYDGVKKCTRTGCDSFIAVKIALTEENCQHTTTLDAITKSATCVAKGERQKICLSCSKEIDKSEIPMKAHNLKRVDVVQPTCQQKGTSAYFTCLDCGKLFDGTDASVEITKIPELDVITHEFREIGGGNNLQCIYCKEVLHVKKKAKDGTEDTSNNIQVNNKNVGIKQEQDKIKEDTYADVDDKITIESEIIISEREEVSEKLDEVISSVESVSETVEIVDKVSWDIEINKVTTYEDSGEVDREAIKEINDLIEIVIKIPAELKNSVDFLVHRLHINESGEQENHTITTTPNPNTGEYIIVSKSAGTVTLKVKKFSEYVLVGYATTVNVEDDEPSTSGSTSSPSKFTVQFKANGGTSVSGVSVKNGNKITAPSTTRDGYVFAGWYLDADFTEKFDFNKPITRNMTLYAKWEKEHTAENCDGTEASGCVALKFKDVDTSLWYHLGIDFAIQNGLMKGVSDDMFAPDANITRGMLVTVLGRREGVEDSRSVESAFTDVSVEQYYASHINWAVENNIVNGYGDGLFGPEDFVTREQVAAIIHRYAKHKGYDVSVGENTNIISYDDYDIISEYAISSAQYVVGIGLMKGKTDTTFNPVDNSTRAEIATILYRFFAANK